MECKLRRLKNHCTWGLARPDSEKEYRSTRPAMITLTKSRKKAAELIDIINAIEVDQNTTHGREVWRLKALAMTYIEDAAMWGVKAATKPK